MNNNKDSQNRIKSRITMKIELTDYGTTQAIFGDSIKLYGEWISKFNNSKQSYLNDGYRLVHEDIDKGEFTVEKENTKIQ
ncbi:hypothetical protein [Aquimarina macrocephali]|uniref:hypothetical protein n=1 Tax=Aquimarina macrocephali TaxID=666563 RepID=UPI00046598B8|nr:hypothetical protein [Aquimarina macrocephali]